MRLSDLVQPYTDYLQHERQLRPQTVTAYVNDLRQLAGFVGAVDVESVGVDDLRAYLRQMSRDGLHVNTIRRRFHGFGTLYEWLQLESLVTENLAHRVRLPKRRTTIPRWLSPDELHAFVRTPAVGRYQQQRDRNRAAWHALAWLGLRRSELLRLQVADVRLAESLVVIRDTKGGDDRTLYLLPELADDLAQLIGDREGPVFVTRQGNQWGTNEMWAAFRGHLVACGLDDPTITPHSLRHTFGTRLARAGVSLDVIRRVMGHRDIKSTLIYLHQTDEDLREAMEKLTA